MRLRLLRNATQRLHYAGRELLLDPFFAPKHSRPSFAGRSPNPLVDLPCPPEEIMAGAELRLRLPGTRRAHPLLDRRHHPLRAVRQIIERFRPDVIVTHSSGAMWKGNGPIVMDAAQTLAVCRAAPESRIVAIHLDSLDHGEVTREDLRAQARAAGIPEARLLIPADGETLEI